MYYFHKGGYGWLCYVISVDWLVTVGLLNTGEIHSSNKGLLIVPRINIKSAYGSYYTYSLEFFKPIFSYNSFFLKQNFYIIYSN